MAVYIHKKNGISFAANSSQIFLHLGPPQYLCTREPLTTIFSLICIEIKLVAVSIGTSEHLGDRWESWRTSRCHWRHRWQCSVVQMLPNLNPRLELFRLRRQGLMYNLKWPLALTGPCQFPICSSEIKSSLLLLQILLLI